MYELHQVLLGREAAQDLLTERLLANALDEGVDDWQRDVGLEKRHADLPQGLRHVALGDAAVAAQALENEIELVAESVEHPATVRRT